MISKDKMFIVASNLDESIKSQTVTYDVTLFKTFVDFETYLDRTPCTLSTIVISGADLPFTGENMSRLLEVLASPFLRLKGNLIYLISDDMDKDIVSEFIEGNNLYNWKIYVGDLSPRFISSIVSGEGRDSEEEETVVQLYRMRQADYVKYMQEKHYEDTSGKYDTDEDLLSGIPDEPLPDMVVPEVDFKHRMYYVVGEQCVQRTLFAYVLAQYLSLTEKTIIVESDVDYHTLGDMATKSGVKCKFVSIEKLFMDCYNVLADIKSTPSRLIIVVATDRVKYDYNFIMDLLISNLTGFVTNFVEECDYEDAPYGKPYTIVCGNTVPEVIKCCLSLKYDVYEKDTFFVGLQCNDLGPMNITSDEMTALVNQVLGKNSLVAQVVQCKGVQLKGDGIIYDVFSLVGRGYQG